MFNQKQIKEMDRLLAAEEDGPAGRALTGLGHHAHIRAEFAQSLEAELRASSARRVDRLTIGASGRALRLSLGLAAIMLVAALLWLFQPTQVSAQEVIQRASAVILEANQIVHRTYAISPNGQEPYTGSAEVWIETDASSGVARSAVTVIEFNADGDPATVYRQVFEGGQFQIYRYDVAANTVGTKSGATADGPNLFDGQGVAKFLQTVSEEGLPERKAEVVTIPDFHGMEVIALRFGEGSDQTAFYFDPESYVLRGFYADGQEAWLTGDDAVAPADVPADAFTFSLPEGASVEESPEEPLEDPAKSNAPEDSYTAVLVSLCGLSEEAVSEAAKSGQTVLEACQSSNPSVTEDRLVAALLEPIQARYDAVVAASELNADEAAAALETLREKFRGDINAPLEDK